MQSKCPLLQKSTAIVSMKMMNEEGRHTTPPHKPFPLEKLVCRQGSANFSEKQSMHLTETCVKGYITAPIQIAA